MCSWNIWSESSTSPTIIGRGSAHTNWVVEADDYKKLAPVGCVGELLTQSYAIARGYYGDDDRTKASFMDVASIYRG